MPRAMGRAVIETTASAAAKCQIEITSNCIDFYIPQDDHDNPLSPYRAHT